MGWNAQLVQYGENIQWSENQAFTEYVFIFSLVMYITHYKFTYLLTYLEL